jgi:hypothetical protein
MAASVGVTGTGGLAIAPPEARHPAVATAAIKMAGKRAAAPLDFTGLTVARRLTRRGDVDSGRQNVVDGAEMSTSIRQCPICGKQVPPVDFDAAFRPFCSERCQTIDLGGWLDARYRISVPMSEADLDDGGHEDGDARPLSPRSN